MIEKIVYEFLNENYSQNSGEKISPNTKVADLSNWSSIVFIKLIYDLENLLSKEARNFSVVESLTFRELLDYFE